MRFLAFLLLFVTCSAGAQVYRWVDQYGTVHYSNAEPPPGVKAVKVDIEAKAGPEAPDTKECYTLRCQGERMERRLALREDAEARALAARVAAAPPQHRGLDFRKYISIQRNMSEGELFAIAGPPDLRVQDRYLHTYTYLPTVPDPFITTIKLLNGRVHEIDRVRKF